MNIPVVYDNIFGNAAQLVKTGASERGNDHQLLAAVSEARKIDLVGAGLLVVGSATIRLPSMSQIEALHMAALRRPAQWRSRGVSCAALSRRGETIRSTHVR